MKDEQKKLQSIQEAVSEYHRALDQREHGGVAQDRCIKYIEQVLGMPWIQSASFGKGNRTEDCADHLTQPKRKHWFYRVNRKFNDKHGLDLHRISHLLTEGRCIRWESTGAEYGLIESTITEKGRGELNVVDPQTRRTSDIYFEQFAEICLNEEEARALNLGFPS